MFLPEAITMVVDEELEKSLEECMFIFLSDSQ